MGRNTTLNDLLQMFREEIGVNTAPAVGGSWQVSIEGLLRRTQEVLYDEHDWTFKHSVADKATNAGQRYYDIPEGFLLEGLKRVFYRFGSEWVELARGIRVEDYNASDPDSDERSDPAIKWDVHGHAQVEIWPLPASASKIRFDGILALPPLYNPTDRATLDDRLIVLYAAAEWLSKDAKRRSEAEVKMSHAKNRLTQVRSLSSGGGIINMNRYAQTGGRRPTEVRIVAARG